VIVPAYNSARYVAAAIRSALDQTFRDREVIVVNDGSTDATADAIKPFLDDVVYIEQPNRGVAAARNTAIRFARGSLIAPLDADDVWLPERLDRMIAYLDDHPEFGMVSTVNPRSRRRFKWTDQLFWIGQLNFITSKPVIRRALFDAHGFYDEDLHWTEDWELWIRFISAGVSVGAAEGSYDIHRRHPESATADLEAQSRRFLTMLERVDNQDPYVPGLSATLSVARGRVAIIDRHANAARRHFAAAAADSSGSARTRLMAVPFAVAPAMSWRLYRRRIARFRREGAERDAERAARAGIDWS
jgi:glycosyltransferase involved in cell wall biosynthesis